MEPEKGQLSARAPLCGVNPLSGVNQRRRLYSDKDKARTFSRLPKSRLSGRGNQRAPRSAG
ncbi:MAG: hypothetical protein COT34_01235 [Candidatus Nealsonbacteria bacterium CG08_land_8_20_14_0_20_43_11]|uniref:Uncharacterized protein n=1 Tax=Candidatus Nealsonbacteria bacterium CG08_land_8_20_14_0_20_43_11 TaxID=1974706 RepID=A0A2M6T0Y6_9BACT|nr:MAG: hypothetical protein COT34_01235 [Candidatus Nealsonbacteria bacterium CG08_land_8_20_14_0_20_43_11]